jgi:hypothetical protein
MLDLTSSDILKELSEFGSTAVTKLEVVDCLIPQS